MPGTYTQHKHISSIPQILSPVGRWYFDQTGRSPDLGSLLTCAFPVFPVAYCRQTNHYSGGDRVGFTPTSLLSIYPLDTCTWLNQHMKLCIGCIIIRESAFVYVSL